MTDTHIAKLMWDAYAIQAGGKTFDGKPLPTWDELGAERQSCWVAAASVTASRIEKLEAALRKIKDLHDQPGPEDEQVVIIRDDMTYFIVCEALDAK
jgi:hypothetical protein